MVKFYKSAFKKNTLNHFLSILFVNHDLDHSILQITVVEYNNSNTRVHTFTLSVHFSWGGVALGAWPLGGRLLLNNSSFNY
jgi:hypothetical protein